MLRKSLFIVIAIFMLTRPASACDACGCTLSRSASESAENRKPFFFDFNFEEQNWDALDPHTAHSLHHQGHHVHDKTHEEFYHFTLGANSGESWTFLAELPYIERHSLEIDDHTRLGEKEVSNGFGDLNLTAVYKLWIKGDSFLGPVAGIKLPTGETNAKNSTGERFEQELQPGSGSVDFSLGAAFRSELDSRMTIRGNALWLLKTEGDQNVEYGDLFSSYVILDWSVNPEAPSFRTSLGIDANFQVEAKQRENGVKMADSGGITMLLGPTLTVRISDRASFFGKCPFSRLSGARRRPSGSRLRHQRRFSSELVSGV